jgi:hypothetical protein
VTVGGTIYNGTTPESFSTSLFATDRVITKKNFFVGSLVNNWFNVQRQKSELCADATGTVVLCNTQTPTPGPDFCTNISGIQTTIPVGMYVNGGGKCLFPGNVPTPDDYCHNIAGAQTTMVQYSDRGTTVADPKTYYAITFPNKVLTALTNIRREVAFDLREQQNGTDGENYQFALTATDNAITLLQNAITAGGTVSSYGGPGISGKNLGDYLNQVYNSVKDMRSTRSTNYEQLAINLYSFYKDARYLQTTQLSFDSAWNCLPIPTLTKVQFTKTGLGRNIYVPGTPATLTFDRPLLTDQTFKIWGYLTANGFRDAKIRYLVTVEAKEDATSAVVSTGSLSGFEFYCIQPETISPFPGIPSAGAVVGYQYQQWADVNGSYELVRSNEPFDNDYKQKNNNCQTNPYPKSFNYQ